MISDYSHLETDTNFSSSSLQLRDFLAYLRGLDIHLVLDKERLMVNAPEGALTNDLKAAIQERKPEIMSFLQEEGSALKSSASGNGTGQDLPRLRRRSAAASHPLSASQRRLWFLDRMAPGNPIYNMPCDFRISGQVDIEVLERSLKAIMERHEVLRTVFTENDGTPSARVLPVGDWKLKVVRLDHVPAEVRQQEALQLAHLESKISFDLTKDLPFHCTLYVINDREYRLLAVMHHVVTDGWSSDILLSELSRIYCAFRRGESSPLAPLEVQYADFATWHSEWLESGILAQQLPYWEKQLAAPLPVLELPFDRPRPPVPTFKGKVLKSVIPSRDLERLRRFSIDENVSLFMTLFTGFQILLARYSGQYDVITGTAVAGRSEPELDNLIGFFINNLVLRTDLSGNPTVSEAVRRVRDVALDAFSHQNVPFDRLVEALRPERSLNRQPLFQTLFMLQNWHEDPLDQEEDIQFERLEIDSGVSRYDFTIEAMEEDGALALYCEFSTDLFDDSTIERIQKHYHSLLMGMVSNPDLPIGKLPLITEEEAALMLSSWNDTVAPFDEKSCVHELIEAQAERTPDAEAVRFGDVSLTYRELTERANQLAHRLIEVGVKADSLVGICVERTHEIVIATLGVWKAGGAYVPLDPAYPQERLGFMASDAGLTALITEEAHMSIVPGIQCPIISIDRDRDKIASAPTSSPDVKTSSRQLAYVIYTSGSTGKPKGVLLEHRSVVNFLQTMQRAPGLRQSDTFFSVTTLSFDIAVLELWLPLITGARVVLASREVQSDGVALARAIREAGTTVMQATPATWRLLLDSGWKDAKNIKILCGGEAMPRALADALLDGGAELWNMYGPTETTVWSTIHKVGLAEDPISIGRPIANTTTYVLDEHQLPVPVKVPGELYIGGDGLARGYHNRPELTSQQFVPDPFSRKPDARLYRTGDQVRYLPDGKLEYLGRLDNQVKVRGFRIELGEIESRLETHERVRQAVVMVREDIPGDQRLVAYLLTTPGEELTGSSLRTWLSEFLPPFMVPSTFVTLDEFPLTPNGKVNRRALPKPEVTSAASGVDFISPQSGMQSSIAEIWKSILHVDRVGVNDNFFDLGGHSLLAVQLQSRVREQFQRDLPLMELFRRPTVAAIAEFLAEDASSNDGAPSGASPKASVLNSVVERARARAQQQNRMRRRD